MRSCSPHFDFAMFRKEYEPPAAPPALPALHRSVQSQSPSSGKSHSVKSTVHFVQTVFNYTIWYRPGELPKL
jgi:hypothetical protein